jgi:hypothetical protein
VYVILLVLLVIILLGALPTWPYARDAGWGYYPSGLVFVLIVVLLVLLLTGRL